MSSNLGWAALFVKTGHTTRFLLTTARAYVIINSYWGEARRAPPETPAHIINDRGAYPHQYLTPKAAVSAGGRRQRKGGNAEDTLSNGGARLGRTVKSCRTVTCAPDAGAVVESYLM